MNNVNAKQKEIKKPKNKIVTETDWLSLCEINEETVLPPITPSIIVDEATWICTQGELMVITGQKKTGKTSVIKHIMATALMPNVDPKKTLGIRAVYTEKLVVFVDTEQSKQRTKEFINHIGQIAGLIKQPKNLKSYNIRALDMNQRLLFLEQFFKKKGSKTFLLVIDGITDFIDSVNNEEVSKSLIDSLLRQLGGDLSIIVTIHEGKDKNGARGHIGQEIERKCVGAISVSKDRLKKIHKISCKLIRNHADFEDIFFQFDDNYGDFKRLDATAEKEIFNSFQGKSNEDIKAIFNRIFAQDKALNKKSMIECILNIGLGIDKNIQPDSQRRRAKRMIDKALLQNIIIENPNQEYELIKH